ncbi:MAG TPA: TonB-dependent receptor, partial [Opitutaceae bacterium]|nr:TonB-dependent receptor [Opitutaceae bacterium]
GWLKYLGFHQLTGYDEYKYRINRRYSYRDAIADTPSWLPAGVSRGNQGAITGGPNAAPNLTRGYYRYYVGDANGTNVDYAPTEFTYGNYPFVYGNPTNGFIRDPRALGQVAVTDATGGPNNSKTILKTAGAVIQSHFFDDRLVTTFGLREDKQYVKNGNTPQLLNADGETFNYDSLNHWQAGDYKFNSGKTKQGGAVLRPFRDFGFLKNGENNGGVGGFFSGVLRSLALTYNKSDSFLPQDPRISLYQNALPNPQGKGKDYGFWLNVGDKLVVRFNRYDTKQLQSRGGDASTIAQRVLRMDVASNAPFLLQTQALAWVTQLHPTWTTPQITDEVAKEMGLSANLQNTLLSEFNAGSIASTQDIDSTGTEIEINYNPTRYWTVQASVTEGKTVNSNVSSDINQWISERLPIWTIIVDPRTNALWWTTNYGGSQTPAQNYASFIQAPFSVVKQLEGKSAPDIRKYNARLATSFGLAAISDNNTIRKFTIGGALRWEDKGAIGYYGKQSLPAIITDLDASRPIYDKAHLYVDAFVKYRTPLFYDRVMATFQVNVRNIEENGRLQPIGAYPDGTPNAYRIVDPRQFIVQVTFDM